LAKTTAAAHARVCGQSVIGFTRVAPVEPVKHTEDPVACVCASVCVCCARVCSSILPRSRAQLHARVLKRKKEKRGFVECGTYLPRRSAALQSRWALVRAAQALAASRAARRVARSAARRLARRSASLAAAHSRKARSASTSRPPAARRENRSSKGMKK